jgi:hypothetical protein
VLFKPYLWNHLRYSCALSQPEEVLRSLGDVPEGFGSRDCAAFLAEISSDSEIRASVDRHRELIRGGFAQKLSGKGLAAITFLYMAVRLKRPAYVIETGCATGWTSTLILKALDLNRTGHLFSIDVPAKAGEMSMDWGLPEGLEPGFLVPTSLRSRWTLVLGDSRTHLGPLLEKIGKNLGFFYHDSDHTYTHMMWEYTSAWPWLVEGGVMVSDDIGWNSAFFDFAEAHRAVPVIDHFNPNVGAILKR